MMITAILIDDLKEHRQHLLELLREKHPEVQIAAECSSGSEGMEAISRFRPQLVFLDVEMPEMSGFDMLNNIEGRNFDVIFTTAYSGYAQQAIDTACLHYLNKPVDALKLGQAMERFLKEQGRRDNLRQYEILLENLKTTEFKTRKIALPDHHGSINFYPLESIVFCTSASVDQSEGAYTIFHFVNKDKVVASRTLGHYESLLREYDFERSERGYLINMTYVKSLRRNGTEITLEHYPEEKFPVSRKRRESFEARLRAFRQGWL